MIGEDQVEIDENESVEEPEEPETEEVSEEPEPEEEEGVEEEDDEEEDDDDGVEVSFGDESPKKEEKQETPKWVKTLRKVNRKQEAELKRLRRELEQRSTAAKEPEIALGEKPTLKSVKYDDKKYEAALQEWYDRKRQVEEREASKQKTVEEQQKKWQSKQQAYLASKTEHGFKDFEDAEELVTNTLDLTQQNVIVHGAKDSALLVYALGTNPEVLDELSEIKDPLEFSFKVAKIEENMRVKSKKAPEPEKRISSGKPGGASGKSDATLERLRREAEKTGDYSKVAAYKRKKRSQ